MDRIIQYIINSLNVLQGLRKTVVMLSLMAIAVVMRVKGYLSGDNVSDMLKGTILGFFASNGLEHISGTVKEYINSKGQKEEETVLDVTEK